MNAMTLTVTRRGQPVTLALLWPTYRVRLTDRGGDIEAALPAVLAGPEDIAQRMGWAPARVGLMLRLWRHEMAGWDATGDLPPAA